MDKLLIYSFEFYEERTIRSVIAKQLTEDLKNVEVLNAFAKRLKRKCHYNIFIQPKYVQLTAMEMACKDRGQEVMGLVPGSTSGFQATFPLINRFNSQ